MVKVAEFYADDATVIIPGGKKIEGRKAIYEVIPVDEQVSDYIVNSTKDVSSYFKSLGIRTLQESALEVLKNGETSIEEIYPLLLDEQY